MEKKRTKIHVIGSYAVGMTMSTDRFPKIGETVAGYGFKQLHGGKGANQAIAAARLGAEVFYTTCLGNDSLGDTALAMLRAEKIDTSSIVRSESASTGVGFVMVGDSGDNEILIDLGANEELTTADIAAAFAAGFAPDVLLVQLEANLDAVFYALKLAREQGITVILNPAPFRKIPDGFVTLATYITPNQTEAASLLGREGSPEELCKGLYDKYKVKVVLTAGEEGAYVYEGDSSVKKIQGEVVAVTDTTGAGDCFSGMLAVMLGRGFDLEKAVQAANIAAGVSVQVEGVVESLPHISALQGVFSKKGLKL